MTFTLDDPTTWGKADTIDGVAITPDLIAELDALYPKFKIITNEFKAGEQELGGSLIKTLHCTASSTITDLHGDMMTMECVKDMAKQARHGLTIFLNHQYSAPEDVAGKVIRAQAKNSGEADDDGAEIWDLHYDIALTRFNPRVEQTYNQISEDGIRLGVSIGAYIVEYDYKDQDRGIFGGLIINKVLLVETSIVGIPANQRSWVQNGVMGVAKFIGLKNLFDSDEPEFRLEKRLWRVLDGRDPAPDEPKEKMIMAETTPDTEIAPETEITLADDTDDACADCGLSPDECKCNGRRRRRDAEVDETDSVDETQVTAEAAPDQESTAEQTTESADQDTADEITEEATSALEETAPEIALSLGAGATPDVELVLVALEHAAEQVRELKAEKATLESQVTVLTGERDQARTDAEFAAEILVRVAKSPLGRKTQFVEPIASFQARLSGIYDEAFLKLMDETE